MLERDQGWAETKMPGWQGGKKEAGAERHGRARRAGQGHDGKANNEVVRPQPRGQGDKAKLTKPS